MNQVAFSRPPRDLNSDCAGLTTMAERELSAYFRAVTELFGSKQAELSAEDWLHELIETDRVPASTREWRLITAKVSIQLASRVHASSLFTVANI